MNMDEAKRTILKSKGRNLNEDEIKKYNQAVRIINESGIMNIKLSEIPTPIPSSYNWLIVMNKSIINRY